MENIIDSQKMAFNYPYQNILLDGIDFQVKKGQIFGVLGKNGIGKTTLLDLIMGVKSPSKGEVFVLGKNPFLQRDVLNEVAFCSHDIHLAAGFTVNQQIEFYLSPFRHKSNERINYYLNLFGLDKNNKIGALSTGEKIKVQIVSCFLREVQLMVVDEITAVLDIETRILFFKELKKLVDQHKISAVIATNLIEDLEGFADQVLFIEDRKAKITNSKDLASLFTQEKVA